METRKLQQVSGGTITVSLPKGWAAQHDLEPGRQVYLDTHADGTLVVRKAREEHDWSVTIEPESIPAEYADRVLRNAYRAGYESITLVVPDRLDRSVRERIESSVSELIGVEVVDATDTEITIQCLLDPSDVSIRQSVVQLEYVTSVVLKSADDALFDDPDESVEISYREREADRIVTMIDRHVTRSLLDPGEVDDLDIDRLRLFQYYATVHQLENVIAGAASLATMARDRPLEEHDDSLADLRSVADRSRMMVERATQAVVETGSTEMAIDALEVRDEVAGDIASLHHQEPVAGPDGGNWLRRVLDAFTGILDAGGEIADVAIEGAYHPDHD